MKNSERFNTRYDHAEEKICELEGNTAEIMESEERKKKIKEKINRESTMCGTLPSRPA